MKWSDIKYEIADRFFARELDEAYDAGIRVGAEYAARKISFAVATSGKDLTKTQKIGKEFAFEVIQQEKKEIQKTTGAML